MNPIKSFSQKGSQLLRIAYFRRIRRCRQQVNRLNHFFVKLEQILALVFMLFERFAHDLRDLFGADSASLVIVPVNRSKHFFSHIGGELVRIAVTAHLLNLHLFVRFSQSKEVLTLTLRVYPSLVWSHFIGMTWRVLLLGGVCLGLAHPFCSRADDAASRYFGIEVVDQDTRRGVPMVELLTTSGVRLYTDSAGLIAFYEPGLMNQKVWFAVSAHGYEFAADGFGLRGVSLITTPGKVETIRVKRINIAERLYRITGAGIYRDSILLGRKPPIAEPLLNAGVTGQDGILTALYKGKLYWLYGDTSRLSYGLGNFAMSGARTPGPGALDPGRGFDLTYFTNRDGFVRAMAPLKGEGVVWLSGLVTLNDSTNGEKMVAWYQRRHGLGEIFENGFMVYNDQREEFEKIKSEPLDTPHFPTGYPSRIRGEDGVERIYFTTPYPALRVRAVYSSYLDLAQYEGYTCLKAGTRFGGKSHTVIERDASGKPVWSWKPGTPSLDGRQLNELVDAGILKREECPFRLADAATGKPILLSNCSCFWNEFRRRYVMIASEALGETVLGEVWYAEAERPEGPWDRARKIITHANKKGDAHDFYNPTQHPFFDEQGGRVIYLEGSYVNTFSGNPSQTPYYEYNQIMYRLDLSDPRLR